MITFLEKENKKYLYDSASGACVPLSSLQFKVAELLDFPLKPVCPTSVRYSLAKYESSDVKRAYAFLYDLFEKGIIGGESAEKKILTEGQYAFPDDLLGLIK